MKETAREYTSLKEFALEAPNVKRLTTRKREAEKDQERRRNHGLHVCKDTEKRVRDVDVCPSNVCYRLRDETCQREWRPRDARRNSRRLPLDFLANTALTYERKRLLALWPGGTRVL